VPELPPGAEQADLVRSGEVNEAAEQAADAQRRGATYWLLARLILEAPTSALLEELKQTLDSSAIDSAQPLGPEVLALREAVSAATAGSPADTDLQVEHTRLWRGLSKQYGPPPPYESVIREDRLPGDATTAAAAEYASAGLDPEVADAGPADHLAVELRYLALCSTQEAAAWKAEDRALAAEWNGRQLRFLDEHLLRWAPAHCAEVGESARTRYHRAVAALLARALALGRSELV
jgi:TorA maturation chaperone TorD